MPESTTKTIYIKGLWHQGLVAAAVWSNDGFNVLGLCDSMEEANSLGSGTLPVFEPGLEEIFLKSLNNGNLKFIVPTASLPAPDFLCFMHDTEVDDDDNVNLENFFKDVTLLHYLVNEDVRVLVTSQVPPGTCEKVLLDFREALEFEPLLAYMPENLRLGKAIERFRHPDLPVIGINDGERTENFSSLFPRVLSFEFCTLTEAEILKSSLNVFLAISITFGNEISEICDQFGADGSKVMKLLKIEPRISKNLPIMPGMPFSGGTLGRDVQNLQRIPTSNKGGLIKSIWDSNHHRGDYLIDVIRDTCIKNNLKRVGLLGLTYKADTSTLRRSFPLEIFFGINSILEVVNGYDPMSSHFKEELPRGLLLLEDLRQIFEQSELMVITTPWLEIVEFLISAGMEDKYLIDPYGVLGKDFANEPRYYQFGGHRREL